MTRERAEELLPVIKAFADGKMVQSKSKQVAIDSWGDTPVPSWSDEWEYRIKPEPREWWVEPQEMIVSKYPHAGFIKVREVLP